MALEGTVKIPGMGPVSKKTAAIAAVLAAAAGLIWLRRTRATKSVAAGTTGPERAQPIDGQQQAPPGAFDTSGLGGGLSGYYYGTGGATQTVPPGPGNFADNAEWSQYVIGYMTQTLNANPGQVADALGRYLAGEEVTEREHGLIEEAIAVGGRPPVSGRNGYPPSIRLEPARKPPPKQHQKTEVPDVTGDSFEEAARDLRARDLNAVAPRREPGEAYTVTAQNPRAGAKVRPETAVHLTLRERNPRK